MTRIDDIGRGPEEIVSQRDKLTTQTNEGIFNNLTFQLGRLEESIREHIQETTTEKILPVIDRRDAESHPCHR